MDDRSAWYGRAAAAILLVGAALRTIEYAALGSLWLDELFITHNVTARGFVELLATPLDYNQVAPVGFLAAVKIATLMLGENEAALRLVPYLFSLLGLVVFWRVAERFLGPVACLGAVAIFALSPTLLWLARNVKQYSGDVTVVLLLVLLALRFQEGRRSRREVLGAGVAGGLAILFSQPAVLVAVTLLAVLLVQLWRRGESLAPLCGLSVGWVLVMAVVAVTSLLLSPAATIEFMRSGWSERGFIPLSPAAFPWLAQRLMGLMGLFVGQFHADAPEEIAVAGSFVLLAVIGLVYLLRRHPRELPLLAAPLIAAILGSAVHLLPLSRRVSIYVAPVLLILSLGGMEGIRGQLPRGLKRLAEAGVAVLVLVPLTILLFLIPIPQRREEARPVLQEIRNRWRTGDSMFVLGSADPAMRHYGDRLGFNSWSQSHAGDHDPRGRLRELDRFRGEGRLWIFHTHFLTCQQEFVRSYLEAIGREIDRVEDPYGEVGKREAAAYLYDLSDPGRLSNADAETFPVPAGFLQTCNDSANASKDL